MTLNTFALRKEIPGSCHSYLRPIACFPFVTACVILTLFLFSWPGGCITFSLRICARHCSLLNPPATVCWALQNNRYLFAVTWCLEVITFIVLSYLKGKAGFMNTEEIWWPVRFSPSNLTPFQNKWVIWKALMCLCMKNGTCENQHSLNNISWHFARIDVTA